MFRLPSISDVGRAVALALAFALPLAADAGTSLVKALVERCDRIDDEIVGKETGHAARLAALRCMAGQIGPVRYVHHDTKNASDGAGNATSFGTTLTEERARKLGGPKVPPPAGRYDSDTSPGFEKDLKGWIARAKTGDPEACGEIGATIFLDAQPAKYAFTEERMFQCFKLAGEAGNVEAKFMTGVCYFYGIGCTRSRKKAREALKDWKIASGTTKANRDGWVARRFAEINK